MQYSEKKLLISGSIPERAMLGETVVVSLGNTLYAYFQLDRLTTMILDGIAWDFTQAK